MDRCTEVRNAPSVEYPVMAMFGGRVTESETWSVGPW